MANSAINLSYSGQGFANSGEVLASVASGDGSRAIDGFGSSTVDNTSANITVNFIDGTKTLSFTPSAVFVSVQGNTSTAQGISKVASITNASCVVSGPATWTAGAVGLAVRIVK